ncbi:MAG: PilZ domain-containing protein [Anaerolineales bacterium]|nr:PilZ domain-containing protein [Anaerolineales bacterium]
MSPERRKLNRRHIMFYSRVFDRRTGKFIGYLGNMTLEGLMIISDEPVPVGQAFSLRIDLPEDIYPKLVLAFDAQSVWCEPDIDPHFYNTGFRLQGVSEEDVALINQIVEDYGFRD